METQGLNPGVETQGLNPCLETEGVRARLEACGEIRLDTLMETGAEAGVGAIVEAQGLGAGVEACFEVGWETVRGGSAVPAQRQAIWARLKTARRQAREAVQA